MYKANMAVAAVSCAGMLVVSYFSGFYPVYVALGSVAVLAYLAFAGDNAPRRVNHRPDYVYDD